MCEKTILTIYERKGKEVILITHENVVGKIEEVLLFD